MFSKLLEKLRGKDDLERLACKDDLAALNAYLKTRRVLIPKRPRHFIDVEGLTQDKLLEVIREESKDTAGDRFEPWVLEVDGKRRLPAFSSRKKLEVFSKEFSLQLNKVFALGSGEFLIAEITKDLDIDFVDLNLFSTKSWEIGVKSKKAV